MEHKKFCELAGTVTVGPKGQVVIPSEVREKMGVKPGDKLVALHMIEKNSISFVTEDSMQKLIDKMGEQISEFRTQFKK